MNKINIFEISDEDLQTKRGLSPPEALSFLLCVEEVEEALLLLEQDDKGKEIPNVVYLDEYEIEYKIKPATANVIIQELKKHLGSLGENIDLFGVPNPNAGGMEGVIGNIYQTCYKKDLYQDLESKAAHLLYFLAKDHLFASGNKRIAVFLFIWFIEMNGILYVNKSTPAVSYNVIYALTVFIAKSENDRKVKDTIINIIISLITFHKKTLLDKD